MSKNQLNLSIQELLLRDGFAGIPNLGGFLLKTAEPTLNNFTQELKPSHSQLVFNHQLKDNDGQLAHLISISHGITYKEAMNLIDLIVTEVKSSLTQKKYASFFPFGNFFLNESGVIFFVARTQFNLHLPTYGLQPLKWDLNAKRSNTSRTQNTYSNVISFPQKKEEEVEEAVVVSVSDETTEKLESATNNSIWWNIAAGFALISVSALSLGIAALSWIGTYEKQQMASLSPVFSTNENQTEATTSIDRNESKAPEMVFINGKLIQIGGQNTSKEIETTETNNQISAVSNRDLLNPKTYFSFILDQPGDLFLVGGSYITEKAANIECKQWIQSETPACVFKPKNSSFYRIVLGRFSNKQEINDYSVNLKNIPGVSLSINRWNLK